MFIMLNFSFFILIYTLIYFMIGRATNASINDTCRLQGAKLYVDAVSTGDVQKADEVPFAPNVVRYETNYGIRRLRDSNAEQARFNIKYGQQSFFVNGLYPGSPQPTFAFLNNDYSIIDSNFTLQGRLQTGPSSQNRPIEIGIDIGPIATRTIMSFNFTDDPCLINHVEIYGQFGQE